MSVDLHTVTVVPGMAPALNDRFRVGVLKDVPTVIGSGAGAAVTLTVNATLIPGLKLPPKYSVFATANQDAVINVTGKTAAGFTVTLLPRLAANTLAVGTVDLLVVA